MGVTGSFCKTTNVKLAQSASTHILQDRDIVICENSKF